MKLINRTLRKGEPLAPLNLTDREKQGLEYSAMYHNRRGFAPYVLQNLGGSIRRVKQRIARLQPFA